MSGIMDEQARITKQPSIMLILITLFFVISSPLWANESPKKIKVGIVPQFTVQELRYIWDPVLLSVAQKIDSHFVFVGSPGIPEFEDKLQKGEFDLVYLNPYHMLIANKAQGYEPLVRDVGRSLRGILVARKDSGITDISQLNDQIVAFPAPNALGASLLVRAELENLHNVHIQPRYVKTHSSTYLNVLLGQAKAGGGVMKTFNLQPKEVQESLRIIYKTQKVSTHPIAIHPRVDKQTREKIKNAFLQMGESNQGINLLSRIPIKKIGEASMEDYLSIEKMGLDKFVVE